MQNNKRKTLSFTFDEQFIKQFNDYCVKHTINKSRFVEKIVTEHIINVEKETDK